MCIRDSYVTSVLGKLGMERRTQAAVFAATHSTPGGHDTNGTRTGRG